MSEWKIKIKPGTPATFDPNPRTGFVNDNIFWQNADPKLAHWPTPDVSKPKFWLDFQIPPNTESASITFPIAKTYKYVCVNHPNETGTIIIKPAKKTAFAGKTKKGAFGSRIKIGTIGKITDVIGKIKK